MSDNAHDGEGVLEMIQKKMVNKYRGAIIALELDGRYDVYESRQDYLINNPIAENFKTIGLAMCWLDDSLKA